MYNKKIILPVVVAVCLSLGLWSCRKDNPSTAFEKLQGNWKLIQTGSDDNVNGTIEPREKHAVPSVQDYQMLFKNDGTGVTKNVFEGVKSPDLAFVWQITNYDTIVLTYSANDTLIYHMTDISSSSLTLTTVGSVGLEWYLFAKK